MHRRMEFGKKYNSRALCRSEFSRGTVLVTWLTSGISTLLMLFWGLPGTNGWDKTRALGVRYVINHGLSQESLLRLSGQARSGWIVGRVWDTRWLHLLLPLLQFLQELFRSFHCPWLSQRIRLLWLVVCLPGGSLFVRGGTV